MKFLKLFIIFVFTLVFIQSCSEKSYIDSSSIDGIAKSYVKLSFALSLYDKDYIDGYIGPEDFKKEAFKDTLNIQDIIEYSGNLLTALEEIQSSATKNQNSSARTKFLKSLILALKTRAEIISGANLSFDKESKLIFGVVSPTLSLDFYKDILVEIDSLLPGEGDLKSRWEMFRSKFIIPREQLDTVFKTAIAECRNRTLEYINLPDNESFQLEFVEDQPWGAYNWYKGNYQSLIQINISLPIYIDRVIDYACHEGYPGHHSYHVSHEMILYKKNSWIEHSIVPLFSPQAIISEGLANYGIEVAFTEDERIGYEKDVLCKLAGVNPEGIELYYKIMKMRNQLRYSGIEAARRYLDGKITKAQTINWLKQYQLRTDEEAENSIAFFDKYRSYIISYAIGLDLAREYFENEKFNTKSEKWNEYHRLISNPILPEELQFSNK